MALEPAALRSRTRPAREGSAAVNAKRHGPSNEPVHQYGRKHLTRGQPQVKLILGIRQAKSTLQLAAAKGNATLQVARIAKRMVPIRRGARWQPGENDDCQ